MRELVGKNQHVIMVPANFKLANKGTITEVKPDGFTLELEYEPDGVLKNTYCEFYIETSNVHCISTHFQKIFRARRFLFLSLQSTNFCKEDSLLV